MSDYQGRIFCIGRNYLAHTKELNNAVPDEPVVFIKPMSCLNNNSDIIAYPAHGKQLQHEVEVVVEIGHAGRPDSVEEAGQFISGLTVGLDLTLRDVQNDLKNQGLPWEKAKAFDDSARIAPIVKYQNDINLDNILFSCSVNHHAQQTGNSNDMQTPILNLISYIGSIWSFIPGDLIFTGTPSGVSDLHSGDTISIMSSTFDIEQTFQIN